MVFNETKRNETIGDRRNETEQNKTKQLVIDKTKRNKTIGIRRNETTFDLRKKW